MTAHAVFHIVTHRAETVFTELLWKCHTF